MQEQAIKPKKPLVIGYWHMRFRAQVARLLCEYLDVPYTNKIYDHPVDWIQEKNHEEFNDWIFVDIPYLIDDDITITQMIPIVSYIAKTYGNKELMGKNIEDQTRVDMYLWSLDFAMNKLVKISSPNLSPERVQKEKIDLWNFHLKQKLKFLETYDKMGEWLMGYLTVCDFFIYEMVSYLQIFFPNSMNKCVNLKRITANIGNLQRIKAYENSDRAIKCRLPKEAWDRHVKPNMIKKVESIRR